MWKASVRDSALAPTVPSSKSALIVHPFVDVGAACVVALALVLCVLVFGTASYASTLYVYVVCGVRFVSVYVVPDVTVVIGVVLLFLYTLYPVTPVLSVDADHASAICDDDSGVACSAVGCVGGWVSGVGGVSMGALYSSLSVVEVQPGSLG